MTLTDLASPENAALPFAVGFLTHVIRRACGDLLRTPRGRRVVPLVPLLVGLSLALAGIGTAGSWRERVLLGVMAAATAGYFYNLVRKQLGGAVESLTVTPEPPAPTPAADPTEKDTDPPPAPPT
jgi:hypothetical protein